MTHVPRYVPARTNEGWSVVGLVVLLTAICITATVIIHKRTYKHPTDPTFVSGSTRAPERGTGH